jgi:hypothetical protein
VLTAIAAVYANWYTAYSKVLGPHTPVDTEAKNAAKKAAKKAVRAFVNQYLRFDPVTDEDRTAIGIIFILSNLLCHFDPVIRLTIFSLFLKNIDFPKY